MITQKQLGPDPAEAEPDSIQLTPDPQDSAIVVRLPEEDMDRSTMVELMSGAAVASGLLNLPKLHVYATAEQLPDLAVAAAEIPGIPEGFRLCQIDADTGGMADLPEGATRLSVESLLRLTRSRQRV